MAITQIQQSELKTWEDKFKKDVYPSVKFFKEPIGDDGKQVPVQSPENEESTAPETTMQLYAGDSGIDASWYGKILLEDDNSIYFELSLTKKPFVKATMSLDDQTSEIMKNLYLYYLSWKQYWLESLSGAGGGTDMVSEIRKNRNSKFIIENYSNRMMTLAGVKRKK